MNNEINLLPNRKGPTRKDSRQLVILRFTAVGMLLFVAAVSVGLFLITSLSPLPKLKEQEAALSTELDLVRDKIVRYGVTLNRLDDIDTYVTQRKKYPETLDNMQGVATDDVTVSGVKLEEQLVTLTVTSPSLKSMNDMITSLKFRSEGETLFKNFALSKLTYNGTDNNYSVGLEVELR